MDVMLYVIISVAALLTYLCFLDVHRGQEETRQAIEYLIALLEAERSRNAGDN